MSTVRIDPESHERLKRLARAENVTLQTVLERALKRYEDALFFERMNADLEELQRDPVARRSYQSEVAVWDGTLADGWPSEPP